jgi:hypothetical protein
MRCFPEVLRLEFNEFSSTVSPEVESLGKLRVLMLSNNAFEGSLPSSSLTKLSNLQSFDVSSNQLTGNAMHLLPAWPELEDFTIDYTELTGRIPEYSKLPPNLKVFSAVKASLSGSFPATFTQLTHLEQLYLESDKFASTFPRDIGSLSNLGAL